MSVFGPLVPDRQVELAIVERVEPWALTYLNEVCRQNGRPVGSLDKPRSWKRVSRFPTSPPEAQLPYVAVVSPGPPDQVVDDGTGVYAMCIPVSVGVLVAASDDESARSLASDYGVALAAATLQKAPDHPLVSQVSWRGYRNDDGPDQDRALATSIHVFWVTVEDVLDAGGGPRQPDPDPDPQHDYPAYGQVQAVEITVDVEETQQ